MAETMMAAKNLSDAGAQDLGTTPQPAGTLRTEGKLEDKPTRTFAKFSVLMAGCITSW
jgi:hypothetical protein